MKVNFVKLTVVNIFGPFEESRNIVLEHSQRLVEVLQHPDHGVVLLNVLLGFPQRHFSVETPENIEVSWRDSLFFCL